MAYVLPSNATGGEVGRLKALVAKYFPVYETRVTPNSLVLAVQVDRPTMADKFDQLRQELWPMNYVPMIRQQTGETIVEILRRPTRTTWRVTANVVMLVLTAVTCLFAGAFLWVAYVGGSALNASAFLWGGLEFAVPLMAILGFHELAHFLVARRHHVEASLPFFLPMPPPFVIFGTFGAFISLREPIPDRKTLLDIGASGPIAGFILALPVTLYGLFLSQHSPVLPLSNCGPVFLSVPYGNLVFGVSAIFYGLSLFFPASLIVNLSPLAIAGWVGLLVTAINLLPAGQLDGGHVFRALFGPRAVIVSWLAVGALFVMGIFYPGWWIFAFLILILGARHPPPLNDITPLDWKRTALGAFAAAILVAGFVAIPLETPTGDFAIAHDHLTAIGSYQNYTRGDLNFSIVNNDLVPHAFFIYASVQLHPADPTFARSFGQNLTWTLLRPGQPNITVSGAGPYGNFSLPSGLYLSVNATGGALSSYPLVLEFSDPLPAIFTLQLQVTEDCRNVQSLQSGAPQTTSYPFPS